MCRLTPSDTGPFCGDSVLHEVDYIGGPDDLSGGAKLWLAGGLLAVVLVIFMQTFTGDVRSLTTSQVPAAVAHSESVEGGQYSEFAMSAKAAVKMRRAGEKVTDETREEALAEFNEVLADLAITRTERLRLAIVAGELIGKDEAIKRITELQKELESGSELASDATWLKMLYEKSPDAITPEAQTALLERHDWFGKLAMAFGKPVGDQYRRAATSGRARIRSTYTTLGLMQILCFLAGIGALGWTVSQLQTIRTEPDFAGIAVSDHFLEAFVLFCAGFVVVLGLSILPFGLQAEGSIGAMVFSEFLIWLLVAFPLYPILRGVSWKEFRRTVGFHAGEGVAKEFAYGVVGFLAWMPLLVVVSWIARLIQHLVGGADVEGGPGGYPMFQPPPSDSSLVLFFSFISAVIWAPLVEETMFRGFLHGWLRQRLGAFATVAIVSIAFGIIHPYSPLGMLQVAVGGVLFGILREWRGSIIAPMVAHALHNGQIEATTLAILRAIGG